MESSPQDDEELEILLNDLFTRERMGMISPSIPKHSMQA